MKLNYQAAWNKKRRLGKEAAIKEPRLRKEKSNIQKENDGEAEKNERLKKVLELRNKAEKMEHNQARRQERLT